MEYFWRRIEEKDIKLLSNGASRKYSLQPKGRDERKIILKWFKSTWSSFNGLTVWYIYI